LGTLPRLARGYRLVGRIVIHGPEFKRCKAASPALAALPGDGAGNAFLTLMSRR
jgi:hypothetical protein